MPPSVPNKVVVHPIVLLSTVDHYNRTAANTKKRAVGVLLGSSNKGVVDVLNSFAVPFEEDDRQQNIWFLDHTFLEAMAGMFRKVNANENIVGWYSTGPKLKAVDLDIHDLFRKYTPNPVYTIIDVKPQEELEIPTKAYVAVEDVSEAEASSFSQPGQHFTFKHINSSVEALESEEVGVEHLLRDIKDASISSLSTKVTEKSLALKSLISNLQDIGSYLDRVCEEKLPVNNHVINQLQNIFNLIPNLNVQELVNAFAVKNNDMSHAVYLSSLVRSIIALHNLILNKAENMQAENNLLGENQTNKKTPNKDPPKDAKDAKDVKKPESKKEEKK